MSEQAKLIDGKKIAKELLTDLQKKIENDTKKQLPPAKLAIILVGEDAASLIYVQNKIKAAKSVGIKTQLERFSSEIEENTLLAKVTELNNDKIIDGIIVQLPLPSQINKAKIIQAIAPQKDVDGFHPINLGLLFSSYQHKFVPCTALGCLYLIKSVCQDLTGKKVVIIGRSNIVGRPLAALLLKANCSVTICHSHSAELSVMTRAADIVIAAIGKAKFLTKDYFRPGAIIIDVGINRYQLEGKNKLVGDVDFANLLSVASHITPVPGGVGPMTVAYLLINSYIAKFGLNHYQRNCDE